MSETASSPKGRKSEELLALEGLGFSLSLSSQGLENGDGTVTGAVEWILQQSKSSDRNIQAVDGDLLPPQDQESHSEKNGGSTMFSGENHAHNEKQAAMSPLAVGTRTSMAKATTLRNSIGDLKPSALLKKGPWSKVTTDDVYSESSCSSVHDDGGVECDNHVISAPAPVSSEGVYNNGLGVSESTAATQNLSKETMRDNRGTNNMGSGVMKDSLKKGGIGRAARPGALPVMEPRTNNNDGGKGKNVAEGVEISDPNFPLSGPPPLGIGLVEWVGQTEREEALTASTNIGAVSALASRKYGKFSSFDSDAVTANDQDASWEMQKHNPAPHINVHQLSVQTQKEKMKSDGQGSSMHQSNDHTRGPLLRSSSSKPPGWEGFDDEFSLLPGAGETQVSSDLPCVNNAPSAFPDDGDTGEYPVFQQQEGNEQVVRVPEAYTVNDIVDLELPLAVDAEPIKDSNDRKRIAGSLRPIMIVLVVATLCAAAVLVALGVTGNLSVSPEVNEQESPTLPPTLYSACDYGGGNESGTSNVRAGCWIQVAEDVTGNAPESLGAGASRGPNFGSFVSLSEVVEVIGQGEQGKRTRATARLAVSAPDEVSGDDRIGVVRVYDLDLLASRYVGDKTRPEFVQVGKNIVGFSDGNRAQHAILSGNGRRLAVGGIRQGSPSSDSGENLALAGWVQVYELMEEASSDKVKTQTWKPIGSVIYGKNANEDFGKKLALSHDGSVLVVGATGYGLVRVYRLIINSGTDTGSFSWDQMGPDLKGPTGGDDGFGQAVGIAEDGIAIVVGAPKETGPSGLFRAGCVRVYRFVSGGAKSDTVEDHKNNSGSWLKQGRDLCGSSSDDRFGASVSISSNGMMLAASAPSQDRIVLEPGVVGSNGTDGGNGTAEDIGCVRIFAFTEEISSNLSVADWMQVGKEVVGDQAGDKLSAVSLSADGTSFAAGSATGGIDGTGYARVFSLVGGISNGEWRRMGGTLTGQEPGERFASHLSLSRDARFIAVGSPFANSRGGTVRLFELGWIQVGEDLSRGSRLGEDFGYDVSIATFIEGNNMMVPSTRVAISAPRASSLAGEESAGAVFVYDVGLDHSFAKVGQTLYGAPGDAVRGHLSKDGRRLAVGERYNDGFNGTQPDIGLVRVFELPTNSSAEQYWTIVGQMLYGDERKEQSGKAFCLNNDGSILAIGAKKAKDKRGRVRVYELKENGAGVGREWIPRGQDLMGENPGEGLGGSIAISDDGTVIVTSVGSTTDDRGFIRVYMYYHESRLWVQVGNDIVGEGVSDGFGGYTAISGDGLTVAGGAKKGFVDERGYIRVFRFNRDANEWMKIGGDIDGDEADANLRVVSLSKDGRRVSTSTGETQNHTGSVAVYDLVNERWNRVGGKILGQKPKTNFGHVHAMSQDGSRLIASAPAHGQKSLGVEPTILGLVRLYDLPTPYAN